MVSFTELASLAGDKVGRKLSDKEKAKVFFRQVTVATKKTKVEKEVGEGERKRWLARKAINNWLSRLKNQYRPQEYKKNVKVKVEGALAGENDELEESSSDGEESGDSEEESSTFKKGGAAEEEGSDQEEGGAAEEEGSDQEEGGAAEEEGSDQEEGGAAEEEGCDQEEDPTTVNEEQSEIEDEAEKSSDDSD
jgi:hypothetical protein